MAKFKSYFEVDLPRGYDPEERRAIAAEIIDFVVSRTEGGKDKDNVDFIPYSEAYAKFKGQKNVDLTFSGQMLAEIQLLQEKAGKLRIGIEGDKNLLGKVEGNVVDHGRDFLGITQDDIDAILARYPLDDEDERLNRVAEVKASEIVARDILMRSGVDVEDN